MTASLKMVKLDFYTFKSQLPNLLIIPFMIFIFSAVGSDIILLSITSSWFVVILNTNLFSIQEKNGLERLYGSLSISQNKVIAGRYVYLFLNFLLAYIMTLLVSLIAMAFHGQKVFLADTVNGFFLSLLMFSAITAMQLPIYFKFGYTKGKMLSMIPYMAVIGLLFLPVFLNEASSFITLLLPHTGIICIISLAGSLTAVLSSYHISISCCTWA